MVCGEGKRLFLGADFVSSMHTAVVLQLQDRIKQGGSVKISVGNVHGVSSGMQFAVYPPFAPDFDHQNSLGWITADDVEDTASTGTLNLSSEPSSESSVCVGCRAILVSASGTKKMRLIKINNRLDESLVESSTAELAKLRHLLENKSRSFVGLHTSEMKEPIDIQVCITKNGMYEIRDSTGELIPNLTPLPVRDLESVELILRRLIHVAKYRNVWDLENLDLRQSWPRGYRSNFGQTNLTYTDFRAMSVLQAV